jgi:hypothetical protein
MTADLRALIEAIEMTQPDDVEIYRAAKAAGARSRYGIAKVAGDLIRERQAPVLAALRAKLGEGE